VGTVKTGSCNQPTANSKVRNTGICCCGFENHNDIYTMIGDDKIWKLYFEYNRFLRLGNKFMHILNGNMDPFFGPQDDMRIHIVRQTPQRLIIYTQLYMFRFRYINECLSLISWVYAPTFRRGMRQYQTFSLGFNRPGYFELVNEDNIYCFYSTLDRFGYNWFMSSRDRNILAHATNGNTSHKNKSNKKQKYSIEREQYSRLNKEYVPLSKLLIKDWFEEGSYKLTELGVNLLLATLAKFGLDLNATDAQFRRCVEEAKKEEFEKFCRTQEFDHDLNRDINICEVLYFKNWGYKKFLNDMDYEEEKYDSQGNPKIEVLPDSLKDKEEKPKIEVLPDSPKKEEINKGKINKEKIKQGKIKKPVINIVNLEDLDDIFTLPKDDDVKQKVVAEVSSGVSLNDAINKVLDSKKITSPSKLNVGAQLVLGDNVVKGKYPTFSDVVGDIVSKDGVSNKFLKNIVSYSSQFLNNIKLFFDDTIAPVDPIVARSFDSDISCIEVKQFVETNKVVIINESFESFLNGTTPDFVSNMTDKELYFDVQDDKVRLPVDFYDYSLKFWNGRSFTETDLTLFRIDIAKYASRLTLKHNDYQNLLLFGPTIGMHFYHSSLVKVHPLVRQMRHFNKVQKFLKIGNWLQNGFYFMKLFFEWCSMIRVSQTSYIIENSKCILQNFTKIVVPMNVCDLIVYVKKQSAVIKTGVQWPSIVNPIPNIIRSTKKWILQFKVKLFEIFGLQYIPKVITFVPFWLRLPCHYLFMCVALISSKSALIGICVNNPITCIISPIVEEYNRSIFSTIFLCVVETFYAGCPITVPLHILNLIISRFDFRYNFHVRVIIHSVFNILSLSCGFSSASSILSSFILTGFDFMRSKLGLVSREEKNKSIWLGLKKIPMINYDCTMRCIKNDQEKKGIIDLDYKHKIEKVSYQYIVGPHHKDYLPVAFSQTKQNEFAALENRVMKDTPVADKNVIVEFSRWVKRNYKRIFPHTTHSHVCEMSSDMYLMNSNAAPSVKKKLRLQFEKFRELGIDSDSYLDRSDVKKWCIRESFVKTENLNYRTPLGINNKAPRLIQGGKKEFICLVGPWIASLQNSIKKDWDSNNFICFTSGVKAIEAAKLVTEFPVWLEDDVSAWDASLCKELLLVELWLYKQFGAPRATYNLMKQNVNTVGVTSKGFWYYRQGCRKSGDPYTSLGNSILNALIHLFIYCRFHRIGIRESRDKVRMLVQGDDSLINLPRIDGIDWKGEMLKFGFKAIAKYKTQMCNVEFCSSRLYSCESGITFGPIPGKVMAKFGIFCQPPLELSPYDLLYGSAVGLEYSASSVPILSEYIQKVKILADDERIKYKQKEAIRSKAEILGLQGINSPWRMGFEKQSININTLHDISQRYSYSKWMGFQVKKEVYSLTLQTSILPKILEFVVDTDTSGPCIYIRDNCCSL